MKHKARTIKLWEDAFEEELLPHQTLLHIYFTDRGENFYRWTPRIRGGEVERIFFKMLEVEEKNSPEGVWSDELNRAAEQIPKLKEFKLPVKIIYGGLEEVEEEEDKKWRYKITVKILGGELGITDYGKGFNIGECHLKMSSLVKGVIEKLTGKWSLGFRKRCNDIVEYPHPEEVGRQIGVDFSIWVGRQPERLDYQIIAREVTGAIRSYIREVLLDAKSFQGGFKESD